MVKSLKMRRRFDVHLTSLSSQKWVLFNQDGFEFFTFFNFIAIFFVVKFWNYVFFSRNLQYVLFFGELWPKILSYAQIMWIVQYF